MTTTTTEQTRPVPAWEREFGAEYMVPDWVMVAYAGQPTLWVEHADQGQRKEGPKNRFSLVVADARGETEIVLDTNRTDVAMAVWHWVAVQARVLPVRVEQVRRVVREITHWVVREAVGSSPEAKRLVNAVSGLRGRFGWWHLDDNPREVEWSGANRPSEGDIQFIEETMAQARAVFGALFPREAGVDGDWGLWLVARVYGFRRRDRQNPGESEP